MLDHKGPPPVISGFTYLERLGAGGYSTVYLFEQHMPRREVAVKVMNADVEDKTASRFESEANLMARVSSPPGHLSIYGAGVSARRPPPSWSWSTARRRSWAPSCARVLSTSLRPCRRRSRSPERWRPLTGPASSTGISSPPTSCSPRTVAPVLSDFGISAMSGPGGIRGAAGP